MSPLKSLPPLAIGAALFSALACSPARPPEPLKVLLNSSAPVSVYDPSRPRVFQDYFFLENTFSPLLEYSADNELVAGMAGRFFWSGPEAHFEMREGVRTSGGRTLDAYDAELGLKRQFVLSAGGQNFLGRLLCGPAPLKKVSDPCPGLQVRGGGRELVMKFDERKPFLFHLLTNIDYAVIPRGSVDPVTLAITDYANTSGPYYVSSDPGDGGWELKANPDHYRYSPRMPQTVRAVPLRGLINNTQALEKLLSGEIDYMPGGLVRSAEEKLAFAAAHSGYSCHVTQPVRLIYTVFTDRGMRRLSLRERFFIAAKFGELYKAGRAMCETPAQIFRMEGSLDKDSLDKIRGLFASHGMKRVDKKLSAVWVRQSLFRPQDDTSPWLPGLSELDPRKLPPGGIERADFFLNSGDIGFQDDIGLAANYVGTTFFGLTPAEKERWFSRYTSLADKKARAAMLRELHYATLSGGRVLPVALMSYASVARAPWRFNYPSAFGGDNLWRLRN